MSKDRRSIDLRGEICPYTFVKSKLTLEEMNAGEVLEVIVDYPGAASNVPRSMQAEGHEVLDVLNEDEKQWRIILRKKSS